MEKLIKEIRSGGLAVGGFLVAITGILYAFLDSALSPNPSMWSAWVPGIGVVLMVAQFLLPEPPM